MYNYIYNIYILYMFIIIILLYLRAWAACMYVWKLRAEILEMAMEKVENYTHAHSEAVGLKLSRKRREDTGWVSIIIILYRPSDIWKW